MANEQEKKVLQIISKVYKIYTFEEILSLPIKPKMKKGHLSTLINRLCEKGIILKTERGKYKIINKIFSIYLKNL